MVSASKRTTLINMFTDYLFWSCLIALHIFRVDVFLVLLRTPYMLVSCAYLLWRTALGKSMPMLVLFAFFSVATEFGMQWRLAPTVFRAGSSSVALTRRSFS